MLDRALADFVVACHLAFIVFAVCGGLLALRWRWVPLVHLPAVAWGVYIELSGRICPLTPLEDSLRREAGEAGYSSSFIDHYVIPVVYPDGLSAPSQMVLGALLVLANLVVYGVVAWRGSSHSRGRPDS